MPWPAELPELTVTFSYGEDVPAGFHKTPMDSGPGKTRPRPDSPNRVIPFEQMLTLQQVTIFEKFYWAELSNGALPFTDFSPRTGISTTYRFEGGYSHHYEGKFWRLRFRLEAIS